MHSTEKHPDGTDAESSTDHYGYKKDFRTALPQILAVSVKNLLLLGKNLSYIYLLISKGYLSPDGLQQTFLAYFGNYVICLHLSSPFSICRVFNNEVYYEIILCIGAADGTCTRIVRFMGRVYQWRPW